MKLKFLFAQVLVLCVVYEATATFNLNPCGCNDEGVDVCSGASCKKGSGVTAPRPHPIQSPRTVQSLIKTIYKETIGGGAPTFNPIGDACNCGKQIVKPAPLPNLRTLCTKHQLPRLEITRPSCSCNTCLNLRGDDGSNSNSGGHHKDCNCGELVRAPDHHVYIESHKKKPSAPQKPRYGSADVVSVSIAQRLANSARNGPSERQLQYGSLKEPTVVVNKNTNSNRKVISVNEESFYDTKGDILEIKANMFRRKPEVSSESEESEEVKPKRPEEPFHPAKLRYEDIGYGTYQQTHKPRYVVVKNSEHANHDCKSHNRPRHRLHHFHSKRGQSCGCHEDLLVDQSEVSEQSVSFENSSQSRQFT